MSAPSVASVSMRKGHRFSKDVVATIELVEGLGVRGDGHFGSTVQHRSRKRWNPDLPNLRQVHLIAEETLTQARAAGFDVGPGDLGENVVTRGVDLLALPTGTRLALGPDAVVELTGLRNPCVQIDRFRDGLMAHFIQRGPHDQVLLRVGVMAVVIAAGWVSIDDRIQIELPARPHLPLRKV